MTQTDFSVRLLRMLGEPIHIKDMGPLLARMSHGRFTAKGTTWPNQLHRILRNTSSVINIGAGYYVWVGAWDAKRFGNCGEIGVKGYGYIDKGAKDLRPVLDWNPIDTKQYDTPSNR